jgi:predicted nucleic acid-binding protein
MGLDVGIVVCDTSVLINFLRINRLDLLQNYSHCFLITDHVQAEISDHYPDQQNRFQAGLEIEIFKMISVDDAKEMELFGQLASSGQLGAGECAAIAVASHRKHKLAIDDIRAIKKAKSVIASDAILRTQDLLVEMIKEKVIEIESADELIELWATQHRFKLPIQSFRTVLSVT